MESTAAVKNAKQSWVNQDFVNSTYFWYLESKTLNNVFMKQCILLVYDILMTLCPDGCLGFIVLLAVLAVNDSDLLANFVLHFGQQERVSVGHDGALLQACEEKIPPDSHQVRSSAGKASIRGFLLPPCVENVHNTRGQNRGGPTIRLLSHNRLLHLTGRPEQEQLDGMSGWPTL